MLKIVKTETIPLQTLDKRNAIVVVLWNQNLEIVENKKETNPALAQYVLAVKEIKNAIIDSRYRAAQSLNSFLP